MTRQIRLRQSATTRAFAGVALGMILFISLSVVLPIKDHSQAAHGKRAGLSFEERVAAQRAIEGVYWRHRIWPQENGRPKPALDEVMPESVIRAKVEDYLRKSQALETYWQRPVTGEQLQAEIERKAHQTKQPEVLRELWTALGNDPLVIAECLARPLLAERLARNWYASDERFHGELKQRAEAGLSGASTVEQMRQMSGEYHELEWRQGDGSISAAAARRPAAGEAQALDEEQWREQTSKLAQMFSAVRREAVGSVVQRELTNPQSAIRNPQSQEVPVGKLSGLQEDETRFYVMAVVEKGADHLKVASVEWRKTSFDEWWSSVQGEMNSDASVSGVEFKLPVIEAVSADCARETWTQTFVGAPDARSGHTAVWTGSEMILWGGSGNTGGRYNPATDTWTATSITGAPSARDLHTAVWTGSEMIVWGGEDGSRNRLNTGGRYSPATDTWTATSITGAPSARFEHTAVWTGSEMIVWGGEGSSSNRLNTGGRYNPATDTWTATSITGAPSARNLHTSVWTGSEMIVWGGGDSNFNYFNTGGRYNPATDTWMATNTAGAPSARSWHTAIWTGSEMIIWGGTAQNTGGRYNPATDIWTATSITGAPSVRNLHTAVWTGSEMIVWGGGANSFVISFNTGGRYNPATDTWTATSVTGAPSARFRHTAVWTGSEMIIWGGSAQNTGGRYNPTTGAWTATNTTGSPGARHWHSAVWTGSEMIVWGGQAGNFSDLNTGGRYNPATDSWIATNTAGAPDARYWHTAVWTGSEMIVWGGNVGPSSNRINTGGRYNPATDTWAPTAATGAPSARALHTAVWTGNEMIIWGGAESFSSLNTGGRYNPTTNTWTPTTTTGAPLGRSIHTAVWTGSEMIVWGAGSFSGPDNGGRYNPTTDTWTLTTTTGAPSARSQHSAVWTGGEMIVWGGSLGSDAFNTGGRYNPMADTWSDITTMGAPGRRESHTAIWTGNEMIVWGGYNTTAGYLNTGGRYNPTTNTWATATMTGAPGERRNHTAVWTGQSMIVWGGTGSTKTGAIYTVTSTPITISPTSQSFPASGGMGSVAVTASAGCSWTSSSNAGWITIPSGSSGNGNGMVSYSVAANSSSNSRTGTLNIAGITFTITQAGCTYVLSPASQSLNAAGGSSSVTVTTVGNCAWTASSNTSWITITAGSNGSGNGTVNYYVATNTGSSSRIGSLTVAEQTFTVTQDGAGNCAYVISPTSQSFEINGGSGSVAVTAGSGCGWTSNTNVSWITITTGNSGTGNGTVNYLVTANSNAGSRTGTLVVAGQAFTVTQAGNNPVPTLTSLSPGSITAGSSGFMLTVTGGNFITTSIVRWNGLDKATTFGSSTQLTASISASDIATFGSASITVFNPAPGGGTSNALSFTINPSGDDILLSSGVQYVGTLEAAPSGACRVVLIPQYLIQAPTGATRLQLFIASNRNVQLYTRANNRIGVTSAGELVYDYRSTPVSQLGLIEITPSSPLPLQTGSYYIAVANCSSSSGAFGLTATVTVASCPLVSGINPNSGPVGGSVVITGSNLSGVGSVKFGGGVAANFTIDSSAQITATVPNGAMTGPITISKQGCADVQTGSFTVTQPCTYSIAPTSQSFTASGGAGNVAVTAGNGCSWTASSNANWITITSGGSGSGNGSVNYTAAANTSASARTGTLTIAGQTLTVTQSGANPAPTLASVSPNSAIAGGSAFTLTVNGMDFVNGAVVRWNGNDRATTFVSATQLTASIPASDIANAGMANVTVFNPAPGGGVSGPLSLAIREPNKLPQVTSLAPNPVVAGGQNFTLTVNGRDFIAGSTVRWDGAERPTTFVNAMQLTAAIPAGDIAAARDVKITVFTPEPGGGRSNEIILSIANAVANVSAASFSGALLAPDSIVAAFGTKLATAVKIATTTPLPTELEGTTVKVTDSAGAERLAWLFFVAPMQINYLMPAETAAGAATITVKSGDGTISVGTVQISLTTPSLFTANANGQGVAAGVALRVKADGAQVYEPIARFDSTQNRFVPEPIDLGNADEQVFLVLYGSGIRRRSALSAATATIGGLNHPVLFAGAVEGLFGLDQVNAGPLSRSLMGRGEVDLVLMVEGRQANTPRVGFK